MSRCSSAPCPYSASAVGKRQGEDGYTSGTRRIAWGMPADPYPTVTCCDNIGMIQVQGRYSGPPFWGQADDVTAILTPAEMLAPHLSMRMKQLHTLACMGVFGLDLGAFELIAGMARHAEVSPHGLPAGCFGKDMIKHRTRSRNGEQRATIGAPIMGCRDDTLA